MKMLDSNTSPDLFKGDVAYPSSPNNLHGIDDASMIGTDVRVEGVILSTPTQSISTASIASNSDSNDLSICLSYFEEKMANNCKWDDNTTSAFISIMLENKDEHTSSTFKPFMWNKISTHIYNSTGVIFTISQLFTKFQRLRIEWHKYDWLLKQTGLGMDSQSGAIVATDEQWKTLEGMQKGAMKFYQGGLPFYEELTQLFNKSTATGRCARSASVLAPNFNEEKQQQQNLVGDTFSASSSAYGQYRDTTASTYSTEASKSSGKRKITGISIDSEDGPSSKGASSVNMLTQLWTAKELKEEAKKPPTYEDNDPYSIPKCMEVLNAMNLESELYYRAIHLLCDCNMREAFMTMIPEMRYGFFGFFC